LEGPPAYLLGVDLGTSACKAIVFGSDGRPKGSAEAELEILHPRPTWAVGDPEDWWRVAAGLIREAVSKSGVRPSQIAAVGLCGLMHAPVLLGENGAPVEKAILWMDQRCRSQCERLRTEQEAVFRRVTGGLPQTSASAGKLLWLAENRPDVISRARRFMLPKDYLRYRLCGDWATDPGDGAGTGLMDRQRDEWSPELVKLVGFSLDAMPPIRPSSEVRGEVTEQAGSECGLAPGTPVVCGSNDVSCTVQGANARRPGQLTLYLGTAAWLCLGEGENRPRFLGFAATSASCLKWWRQIAGVAAASYDELLHQAAGSAPGAGGLLFFPHLMGERGPVADPRAKGAFFGLTLAHRGPDMLRAILEGVGYHLRQILEAREVTADEAFAVGGGARSPLWLQIIADITGIGVRRAVVVESAALGAAMLAGVGVGIYATAEEASSRLVRAGEVTEPRQALVRRYGRLYELWRQVDAALQRFYGEFPEEDEP
jgi:xylulokinase